MHPVMPAFIQHAERNINFWLPRYATAIGEPESPVQYLQDLVEHNLREAGRQARSRKGGMTQVQRRAFREHLAHTIVARRMLATLTITKRS